MFHAVKQKRQNKGEQDDEQKLKGLSSHVAYQVPGLKDVRDKRRVHLRPRIKRINGSNPYVVNGLLRNAYEDYLILESALWNPLFYDVNRRIGGERAARPVKIYVKPAGLVQGHCLLPYAHAVHHAIGADVKHDVRTGVSPYRLH